MSKTSKARIDLEERYNELGKYLAEIFFGRDFEFDLRDDELLAETLFCRLLDVTFQVSFYEEKRRARVQVDDNLEFLNGKLTELFNRLIGSEPICSYDVIGKDINKHVLEWENSNPRLRIENLENFEENIEPKISNLVILLKFDPHKCGEIQYLWTR